MIVAILFNFRPQLCSLLCVLKQRLTWILATTLLPTKEELMKFLFPQKRFDVHLYGSFLLQERQAHIQNAEVQQLLVCWKEDRLHR